MDDLPKLCQRQRLFKDEVGTHCLCQSEVLIWTETTTTGNGDDLRLRVVASKLDDRLESLLFRHDDVHDHDIGRSLILPYRGNYAVLGRYHFVRISGERNVKHNPNLLIIIYN